MPDIHQDTAAQVNWLAGVSGSSKDLWKIVIGHHPLFSVGLHGNTPNLINRFKPVMNAGNVDFYICGQDHDLEYLKPSGESIHYLIQAEAQNPILLLPPTVPFSLVPHPD